MGKYATRISEDAQVLYKKSSITCNTYSCSDASQLTKSAIYKVKRKSSRNHLYYINGNKIKRDLSVETDNCILRRYIKKKIGKSSIPETSSANTTYSVRLSKLSTEDTGDEFKPDTSASGDNKGQCDILNQRPLVVDLTSLMLENLKNLLNDWICKHVLEDDKTKQRLSLILDSIIHKLENKMSRTPSSCSTYVLERNGEDFKVRDRKLETNSITCQYCKKKQTLVVVRKGSSVTNQKYSRVTIPVPYQHLRIISTLSIPRNMHKNKSIKKHIEKAKNSQQKKKKYAAIPNKKDIKIPIELTNPGQYTRNDNKNMSSKRKKRRGIIIIPDIFYESTTDCISASEKDYNENDAKIESKTLHFEPKESLLMSIYKNNPTNFASTEEIIEYENKHENFTMTGTNYTPKSNIHEAPILLQHEKSLTTSTKQIVSKSTHNTNSCKKLRKNGKYRIKAHAKYKRLYYKPRDTSKLKDNKIKYDNIKHKKYNYIYRKTNRNLLIKELLDHMQNIFKYFAEDRGKRNIKLEVHVDVLEVEEQTNNVITESSQNLQIKFCPKNVLNVNPINSLLCGNLESIDKPDENIAKHTPAIIPLLDGATSQAKYIFRSNNSTSISKSEITEETGEKRVIECGTVMTGLEVCKEISNLKCVIRNLSATTEKIVKEHLKKKELKNDLNLTSAPTVIPVTKDNIHNKISKSRGIQFSNLSPQNQLMSGLKLYKEPKRIADLSNRLKKRSSSYHVIDSESIIKVTDMTTMLATSKPLINKCSLPHKSKSLMNIATNLNHSKFLEFFYSERKKKNKKLESKNNQKTEKSKLRSKLLPNKKPKSKLFSKKKPDEKIVLSMNTNNTGCQSQSSSVEYICKLGSCSSVCVDIEDKPIITVKKKERLSCLEGGLYCILLWIPLIVIMYFFYDIVLKPHFNKKTETSTEKPSGRRWEPPMEVKGNPQNISDFLLKLSDFGF